MKNFLLISSLALLVLSPFFPWVVYLSYFSIFIINYFARQNSISAYSQYIVNPLLWILLLILAALIFPAYKNFFYTPDGAFQLYVGLFKLFIYFFTIPALIEFIVRPLFHEIGLTIRWSNTKVSYDDSQKKPEEMVVLYVLDVLSQDFGFQEDDIEIEFPVQIGSSTRRADIVVFKRGKSHKQHNIDIIVECKRADRSFSKKHVLQLQSYMAACMNVRYGVLAASVCVKNFETNSVTNLL